jgi:hypothetical protein
LSSTRAKGVDLSGQSHPGDKGDRRRGDQDHQRRHQPRRKGFVEDQPVHDQCQQHNPEQQPGREEQPREFDHTETDAGQRHQHVAHGRDEPGRRKVDGLKRPVADPVGHDAERQHGLCRNADTPDHVSGAGRIWCHRGAQQQKRYRDRREEGDADGMVPLGANRAGVAQDLQAVEEHEDRENRDRGAENELRNSRR